VGTSASSTSQPAACSNKLAVEITDAETTRTRPLTQSLYERVIGGSQDKVPFAIGLIVLALASFKYAQLVFRSQEKWFHFAMMAMAAFGGVQLHQYYLNQRQIDMKIESLRQAALRSAKEPSV